VQELGQGLPFSDERKSSSVYIVERARDRRQRGKESEYMSEEGEREEKEREEKEGGERKEREGGVERK
jgi:hypothetical protein